MKKYSPKTKAQLQELISDERVYLGDIDTSNITDMSRLFFEDENKVEIHRLDFSGISSWDASKVTDMSHMFEHCYVFNENISGWNVGRFTSVRSMFCCAKSFKQDISGWKLADERKKELYKGRNSYKYYDRNE